MDRKAQLAAAAAVLSAMGVTTTSTQSLANTHVVTATSNGNTCGIPSGMLAVDRNGATKVSKSVKGMINLADGKDRCPADGNC